MEDICFIQEIWDTTKPKSWTRPDAQAVGNWLIADLGNKTVAKLGCTQDSVFIKIIGKTVGEIDETYIPFRNYFSKKRLSPTSPEWYPRIDSGHWAWSHYSHCLPTQEDFRSIGGAINSYLKLFS